MAAVVLSPYLRPRPRPELPEEVRVGAFEHCTTNAGYFL
jgi:hypothetical protein